MSVTSQPDYALLAMLGVAFLVGLVIALVTAHRIKQYSLRTLLIIMTVVAVTLGLIVCLYPRPLAAPPIDHVDVPEF